MYVEKVLVTVSGLRAKISAKESEVERERGGEEEKEHL